MSWTDHQRAILGEMGLRVWTAPGVPEAVEAVVETPAAVATPMSAPEPAPAPRPAPAPVEAAPTLAPVPAVPRRTVPVAEVSRGVVSAAATVPVAGLDWDALAEAVSTCQACALCESRTQTVFGVGHRQAQWMLIGEAPGEQEDLHGEPFVGKAGQLLDNMLRAVGLTRAEAEADRQVYITNVLKCRPPHNRNPEPPEVLRCAPFLQRQIELVRPRLIVAMGRFAVQSLLDTAEPIGRLRGRVHHRHGIPVVVTYHPAYLLRNPLDKARSWEDLCLAREVWRSVSEPAEPA